MSRAKPWPWRGPPRLPPPRGGRGSGPAPGGVWEHSPSRGRTVTYSGCQASGPWSAGLWASRDHSRAEWPFISCQRARAPETDTEREAAGLGCAGHGFGSDAGGYGGWARAWLGPPRHVFTGCCSPGSHGAAPPLPALQVLLSVFYGNTTKSRKAFELRHGREAGAAWETALPGRQPPRPSPTFQNGLSGSQIAGSGGS